MFPPPPMGAMPGAMVARDISNGIAPCRSAVYMYRLTTRVTKELSKPTATPLDWACLNSRTYPDAITASERPNICFPDPTARQRHSFYHAPWVFCRRVAASSVSRRDRQSRCWWLAGVLCCFTPPTVACCRLADGNRCRWAGDGARGKMTGDMYGAVGG